MNRHDAFTRRLVDRHRRTVERLRAVPLSLRRLPAARLVRSVRYVDQRHASQWTIRSAVRFVVIAPGNQSRQALNIPASPLRTIRTTATIAARRTTVHSRTEAVPGRTRQPTAVERFVEPPAVVPQIMNPLRPGPIGREPFAQVRRPAVVPPVPTTSRRRSSAPADAAVPQAPPPMPGWEIPDATRWTGTRQNPGTPSPADVELLTDQVVAVIDRRLLAHLERTGRVRG